MNETEGGDLDGTILDSTRREEETKQNKNSLFITTAGGLPILK